MNQREVIYSMLCQNTGTHFLDSGGFEGRHWERNSKHSVDEFVATDEIIMTAKCYRDGELSLDVTKSLFHHLDNALHYDEHMDRLFHKFVDIYVKEFYEYWDEERNSGYGDFSWEKAMKTFADMALSHNNNKTFRDRNYEWNPWEFEGERYSGYTYNEENILSQDFVYHYYGSWIFIQSNNGCDARGGFSYPHIFQEKEDGALSRYSDYTIGCTNGHWWDFQSGYEESEQDVYLLGGTNRQPVAQLVDGDDASFIDMESDYQLGMKEWQANKRAWELSEPLPGMSKPEFVPPITFLAGKVLLKDGKIYCPVCGEELTVGCY